MKIKLFFYCILLSIQFFYSESSAGDYWSAIPAPVNTNYYKCFFTDQNTGWISGDSGIIIKTTNGGISFDVYHTGIVNKTESLFFVNNTTGWATALEAEPDSTEYPGTIILKTTNGGMNWSHNLYPDTNVFLPVIFFTDPSNGYMGGYGSTIVYTTNAGINWENSYTDSIGFLYPVLSIKFFDQLNGYACGGIYDFAGVVWKTSDGGRNWAKQIVGLEPLRDIYTLNSSKIFLSGGDFKFGASISETTNSGTNWQTDFLGYFGVAVSIEFRTPYEGWISLGFAGKFIYSLDSGNTWTEIYTPDTNKINDIQFTDSLHGWSVGDNGMILKYNSMTSVIRNSQMIAIPNSIELFQNYPNPFNPVTNLEFGVPNMEFVSLKVYNSLGKEVAILVNEIKPAGRYEVTFDGSNLGSGIYFYKIEAGGFSAVKRMILLK